MRTALLLLFLLAVAAVPGSLLPQRTSARERRRLPRARTRTLAPWLDRLSAVRRVRLAVVLRHLPAAVRLARRLPGAAAAPARRGAASPPPPAPARLDRLPHARRPSHDGDRRRPATLAAALRGRGGARSSGRGRRRSPCRPRRGTSRRPATCCSTSPCWRCWSAWRWDRWYGWHGNRLAGRRARTGFCNTLQQYDEYALGAADRRRRPAAVLPDAGRLPGRVPRHRPAGAVHRGHVLCRGRRAEPRGPTPGGQRSAAAGRGQRLPARPRVRADPALHRPDRDGVDDHARRSCPTTATLTSDGRGHVPGRQRRPDDRRARPSQVGFAGVYLPTVPDQPAVERSAFPAERDPGADARRVQGRPRPRRRRPAVGVRARPGARSTRAC